MIGLLILPLLLLVLIVVLAVAALRYRTRVAGGVFARAPRAERWRDRLPLLIAVPGAVLFQVLPSAGGAEPAIVAGFLVLLLLVDTGNRFLARRSVGPRVASLRGRRLRDLLPPVLTPIAAAGTVVGGAGLIWALAAGPTPGPDPCREQLRSGASSGVWVDVSPDELLSRAEGLGWLVAAAVVAVLVVAAVLIADRRPAAGADPDLDLALRGRSATRAVAVLGVLAFALIGRAETALLVRYPEQTVTCTTHGRIYWEPSPWAVAAVIVTFLFAVVLLGFSLLRFAAPSSQRLP